MDDFVCKILKDWGLEDHIERFKEHRINERSFKLLNDEAIKDLLPLWGDRVIFQDNHKVFKESCISNSGHTGACKRISDSQESHKHQSPAKKRCKTTQDRKSESVLGEVKEIMTKVKNSLEKQRSTKVIEFLLNKITELELEKNELVGIFGRSGAGKSSLINAIIGEKNFLPTGCIYACTSVMIKVEANMEISQYEAEIEFIPEEVWKDELWFMHNFVREKEENADQENGEEKNDYDDYRDYVKKMSAVYAEEWRNKTPDQLMNKYHNKEIAEFFKLKKKPLKCDSALELSKSLAKYTRCAPRSRQETKERWYWPLVKCVTIRVPNKDILQHITLVDLPGNGDCSRSRDQMWKEQVGNCSTVWIVSEINRPETEKEPWEILNGVFKHVGNGGQCQRIHFICTKSDHIKDSAEGLAADIRENAKAEVKDKFNEVQKFKKHFSDDCFKVFTVSSEEFLEGNRLTREETEIPELQKILENLNDCHSRVLNYVSGGHGILSLIQGANVTRGANSTEVCRDLENNLRVGLDQVGKSIDKAHDTFVKCLSEGVENSKKSCDGDLDKFLKPTDDGRGFHRRLKSIVKKSGIHQPDKSKEINLNVTLASNLTDSIDDEFLKTFPNKFGPNGPFNGAINRFTLQTEKMIEKYKDVELQLIFLQTEETKIKIKVNQTIRDRKKVIYRSLAETIKDNMEACYTKAQACKGKGALEKMRTILKTHVQESKETMFEKAKEKMLKELKELKNEILELLRQVLTESIDLALKTDHDSLPGFPDEFERVKKRYNELKGSQ